MLLNPHDHIISLINDGNRTEWSPIRSVIIRVINKIATHDYDCRQNWTTRSPVTDLSKLWKNLKKETRHKKRQLTWRNARQQHDVLTAPLTVRLHCLITQSRYGRTCPKWLWRNWAVSTCDDGMFMFSISKGRFHSFRIINSYSSPRWR